MGAGSNVSLVPARNHHDLISRKEIGCQLRSYATLVSGNNPYTCQVMSGCRSTGNDHARSDWYIPVRIGGANDLDSREAGVTQGPAPDSGSGQGVVGAVHIIEAPPAIQQAEGQVMPGPRLHLLQRDQLT